MNILAGTSKGVFSLKGKASQHLLESQEVRDLVRIGDVFFAGTGSGVFLSTDNGKSWFCTGLEDREVWQIRGGEIGQEFMPLPSRESCTAATTRAKLGSKFKPSANFRKQRNGAYR